MFGSVARVASILSPQQIVHCPPDVAKQPEPGKDLQPAGFLLTGVEIRPVIKQPDPRMPLLHLIAAADAGPKDRILSKVQAAPHLMCHQFVQRFCEPERVHDLTYEFRTGKFLSECKHQGFHRISIVVSPFRIAFSNPVRTPSIRFMREAADV